MQLIPRRRLITVLLFRLPNLHLLLRAFLAFSQSLVLTHRHADTVRAK